MAVAYTHSHGDTEPVNIADPKDLEYTLKNLTPGATIEVFVVPMNDGGAGPAPGRRRPR